MIHRYESNGYHIVLDVNSGSVHVVDELVYGLIPVVETALTEDAADAERIMELAGVPGGQEKAYREAISEILELHRAGMLFTEDIYRDYIFDFQNRETVVKALCLHIAHDCNLACRYCFAEEGEYHGRRALMDTDTGDRKSVV